MRRPSPETVVSLVVVAAAAAFVLLQLQPSLLVSDATPAGGDMGAHVWGPAFMRDHLLPHGRITGWAPDWYDGFPAYHYYFPLPSLVIVLLDAVLPYTVAFKLVTVAGLVTLPFAALAFGRLARLPFPAPPLLGVATLPFVFDRFHTIWGGNAAATLAGEFSFSIALSLALVFLGVVARGLDTGRYRALAAALLAATALCHLIPAAFAVGGAAVILLLRRPDGDRWEFLATIGAVGAALTAFWLLPFLARLPYSNDMGWERTEKYRENLMPWLRTDVATTMTSHMKLVTAMAVVGGLLAVARRRPGGVALAAMATACAVAFRFVPEGPIWNARVLPFWYLSLYLLAALAAAEVMLLVGAGLATEGEDTGSRWVPLATPAVGLVVVLLMVGGPLGALPSWTGVTTTDRSFVPGWARWNYSGYEGKPAYVEYKGVVDTMARVGREVGCGRAMWEYEPELDRYGTPMALMLLPYWTEGCIGSMEGLYFESSATVPYHFLNQSELSKTPSRAMRDLPYRSLDVASGVQHLQLLGVRYYMALSPEAQAQAAVNPALRLVATTEPAQVTYTDGVKDRSWQVYEVARSELVEPLALEPAVIASGADGKHGWLEAGVDFYQDPTRWGVPLAADGPKQWARIASAEAEPPRRPIEAPAQVSNVRTSDDRVSFDVDRPGAPVLVKVSYFPNWKASGADGPWRVTPNLMVVIPTGRHVELHYGRTPVDLVGMALTLAGLVGVVLLARARPVAFRARPPRRPAPEPAGPHGDEDDDEGEPLELVVGRALGAEVDAGGNGSPPAPDRARTPPGERPPTSV